MASTSDENRIQRMLEYSLSADVRSQDAPSIIVSLSGSKPGVTMAWEFFKKNSDEFRRRYDNGPLISWLLPFTKNFASFEAMKDIEDFFNRNQFNSTGLTLKQCLEAIKVNAAWLKRDSQQIDQFLQCICD